MDPSTMHIIISICSVLIAGLSLISNRKSANMKDTIDIMTRLAILEEQHKKESELLNKLSDKLDEVKDNL